MNWFFLVPTAQGLQPFAALFNAEACAVLARIIREASGLVGQCVLVVPGVAS